MSTRFRQCLLRRANAERVAWIPERYAAAGTTLRLKGGENWEAGWVVERVFSGQFLDELPDARKLIRSHRKATGDALPKQPKE